MNISNHSQLKDAMHYLKIKSETQKTELRIHFKETMDALKPVNLLKSSVKDIAESPGIATAAIGTTVAIGAAVLSKKMIVGKSANIFKRLLGTVVEFAVARSITNNSDVIATRGIQLLKKWAK